MIPTEPDDGPIGEVPPAVLAYETRIDVTRAEVVRLMTTLHECERQYQAKVNDVLAEMARADAAEADYRYALSERDALAARLRAVEAVRDEYPRRSPKSGHEVGWEGLHDALRAALSSDAAPQAVAQVRYTDGEWSREYVGDEVAPPAAGVTRERAAAEVIDVRRTPGAVKGGAGTRKREVVEAVLLDAARRVLDDRHAGDVYPKTWLAPVADAPAAPEEER